MTNSIHTNEMSALCDWLKEQRITQKLTMRELSERLDKPHSYVQKVEQGMSCTLHITQFMHWLVIRYCRENG